MVTRGYKKVIRHERVTWNDMDQQETMIWLSQTQQRLATNIRHNDERQSRDVIVNRAHQETNIEGGYPNIRDKQIGRTNTKNEHKRTNAKASHERECKMAESQ